MRTISDTSRISSRHVSAQAFASAESAPRRSSDAPPRPQNNSLVEVFTAHGTTEPTTWISLRPGDIVRVKRDDFFPADLLFITSRCPPRGARPPCALSLRALLSLPSVIPSLRSASPARLPLFPAATPRACATLRRRTSMVRRTSRSKSASSQRWPSPMRKSRVRCAARWTPAGPRLVAMPRLLSFPARTAAVLLSLPRTLRSCCCFLPIKRLPFELTPPILMFPLSSPGWTGNVECDAPNDSLYTFMGNLVSNVRRKQIQTQRAPRPVCHACV